MGELYQEGTGELLRGFVRSGLSSGKSCGRCTGGPAAHTKEDSVVNNLSSPKDCGEAPLPVLFRPHISKK